MTILNFTKMHGLGNDFIILDTSKNPQIPAQKIIASLAHRQKGIGFDQMLIIERSKKVNVDFNYRIFNANGEEVEQCGNGARCLARFILEKKLTHKTTLSLATKSNVIRANIHNDKTVTVNMGRAIFTPEKIPFLSKKEILTYLLLQYKLGVCSLGNPHCTLLVDDINKTKVEEISIEIIKSGYFPKGVNIGFMEIMNEYEVNIRIFERDVGETLACGSGACAAIIYGVRLGLLQNKVKVHLRGGDLNIFYQINTQDSSAQVYMRGSATFVFEGKIDLEKFSIKV